MCLYIVLTVLISLLICHAYLALLHFSAYISFLFLLFKFCAHISCSLSAFLYLYIMHLSHFFISLLIYHASSFLCLGVMPFSHFFVSVLIYHAHCLHFSAHISCPFPSSSFLCIYIFSQFFISLYIYIYI